MPPTLPRAVPLQSVNADGFRHAATVRDALAAAFGEVEPIDRRALALAINALVAEIDRVLDEQLNAILAHPAFRRLESAWRGLFYLVRQTPDNSTVRVRVLSVTWAELARDQAKALEFDQSQLFRKVYSEEFGTPGGLPYGLLVGDYRLTHRPMPGVPTDDLGTLAGVASVAAAAFAPFVANVDPRFLGLDDFAELESPIDIAQLTAGDDHRAWRRLRDTEDSRFVALTLPEMVLRPHYDLPESLAFPLRQVPGARLTGGAAWAFAAVVVRAFAESGWLASVRGVSGTVPGLAPAGTRPEVGFPAETLVATAVTDRQEKELAEAGLMPLCRTATGATFYTVPSCQQARTLAGQTATANAKLSAMLPYILCVSRVGHYLKVLMRDRIGAFTTAGDVEDFLTRWVRRYVVSNDGASQELKAKHPLRDARVEVYDSPARPGRYRCVVHLRPHYQLDSLSAGIKLTTELGNRA